MGKSLAAKDVRAECVAATPTPLGELYYELYNQIAWLHLKWMDFRGLYGLEPERVDLLNTTAPAFFHNLQRMMWEDVLLHLCRLTDPPKSAGKDTLTLRRLPNAVPDPTFRDRIHALAENAKLKTAFARDWRNRRLAHRELPPLDSQTAHPLAVASRKDVEDALAAIRAIMNCIERHYLKSSVSYENSIEALGGIDSLIGYLRKGVETERAERNNH